MAEILLNYRIDWSDDASVPTYATCFHRQLLLAEHNVTAIGEGQDYKDIKEVNQKKYDLFIDLDCGRNQKGKLHFANGENEKRIEIPSAVKFIDTHGYPSLHRRLAKQYDHVFFAVWDKRDLFSNLPSAHWCPNASDDMWFDHINHTEEPPRFSLGFFGSKGGLSRADGAIAVCKRRKLPYDIREIGRSYKTRWPRTAEAMLACSVLFNKGQKHDGPNQRVIESMLMNRPLITDRDSRDGMDKLFKEGEHYLGYNNESELGNQLEWCLSGTTKDLAESMAARAYIEVKSKHLIKHRVAQILEVCL